MSKVDLLVELPLDIPTPASMQPARYQPLESLLLAAEMHTSAASQMLDPRDTSAPNKISAPSSASLSCCKDEPCFAPSSLPPIASSLYKQEILPTLEHLLRGASLKMMLDPYRSVGSMPGLPSLHLLPLDKGMLQGGAFPQVSLSMADGSAQVVRPLAQLATCSVVLNNSMEIAEHRNIIHQLLNQTLGITAASNTIMSEPRATQSASLPEKRKVEEEGSSVSGGINYAQCLKKPRSGEENAAYMLQQTLKKDASSHQSALFKLEHRFVSRKRLGIVHDRRGRLREVEDLFLDCPLMRPYIEMGYSAQAVLAAFADSRGPLLVAVKEVAAVCQSWTSSWGAKEAQASMVASMEARKIRQTDTWMSMEFDPEGGKRKEIQFGPRLGELLGVTSEELMCSEIDFICFLLDDMLSRRQAITTHLLVHSRGANWMKPIKDSDETSSTLEKVSTSLADASELLSITHIREHDDCGRLVRLTCFYTHATEEQYNAAISRSLPPLTLHLREQAGFKNLLWRQKIAMQCVGRILHIKKSPEGRSKLLALSQSISDRLNALKDAPRSC